jgi:oligopeptide/dipeptide ABC transporter ATP-binding protein
VAIAIALAGGPKLLIADEPTTALDVTIQAQILELLWRIQEEHRMSVLLITHNLAVVASHCDEVLVMYAGKVVERAPTAQIIAQPLMPYTQALIRSVPSLSNPPHTRLSAIPGLPPSGLQLGAGCRFRERCVHARERCALEQPPLLGQGAHAYACWFPPTAGAPQ